MARVDEVDGRLDGFSFRFGDVAAYQALPALDPRSPRPAEALQSLAESDVVAGSDKRFGLVFATQERRPRRDGQGASATEPPASWSQEKRKGRLGAPFR